MRPTAAFLAICAAAAPLAAENLVKNPSFELASEDLPTGSGCMPPIASSIL